jgi:hypothetical protein
VLVRLAPRVRAGPWGFVPAGRVVTGWFSFSSKHAAAGPFGSGVRGWVEHENPVQPVRHAVGS